MTDERGGRYFREARFFLAGDKVAAQSHILEARSLMGYMRDMHALGGPPIQVQYATLQDGTRIKATMMNGQYQAEIISPPRVLRKEEKSGCAAFWSGLLVPYQSALHHRYEGDRFVEYVGVRWLYPSAYQLEVTPLLFEVYPENKDSGKLAPPLYEAESKPTLDPGGTAPVPTTIAKIYASAYSGEMRVAVQLLLGMEISLVKEITEEPVYSYGYDGTVGLVAIDQTDPMNPAPPEFWMVRMPLDGHGVLARRYRVCRDLSDVQKAWGLEYIPNPGEVFPEVGAMREALDEGDVIEILPAAAFEALTAGYSPCYPDSGWAFSKSGHECQNVIWAFTEGSPSHATMRRVKFSFEATLDHISCTGTVVEESVLRSSKQTAPRYPYRVPYTLVSFMPAYTPAPPDATEAPVHVYYVGDEEQVWRLGRSDSSLVGRVTSNLPITDTRYWCDGMYSSETWSSGSTDEWYSLNGSRVTAGRGSGGYTGYFYRVFPTGLSVPPYRISSGSSTSYTIFENGIESAIEHWTSSEVSEGSYTSLSIPHHQREGACLLDAVTIDMPAHTRQTTIAGLSIESGPYYGRIEGLEPDQQLVIFDDALIPWSCGNCSALGNQPNTILRGLGGGVGLTSLGGAWPGIVVGDYVADSSILSTPVDGTSTVTGGFTFYGAVAVPMSNLTIEEVVTAFQVADATNPQVIYGYTDALQPDRYILSDKVNSFDPSRYVHNTEYPVADTLSPAYHFIGVANSATSAT